MSSNTNGRHPGDLAGEETDAKKPAFAGQWKTPPLPMFPTANRPEWAAKEGGEAKTEAAAEEPMEPATMATSTTQPAVQLPDSTEDYQKALEEAYRRGAQAAAALAGNNQLASAVSCPDFTPMTEGEQQGEELPVEPDLLTSSTEAAAAAVPTTMMGGEEVQHHNQAGVMMPPPPAAASASNWMNHPGSSNNAERMSPRTAAQKKSVSLPDMTTYYAAAQEEEKRQKRLARNRTSARLRRMRKKNLVDAYEQEVEILENTLKQLRAHEWGGSTTGTQPPVDNAGALGEALGMDRGQQMLSRQQRQEAAQDVLDQQLQFVNQLQDVLQEQYILGQLANTGGGEFADLQAELQLSDAQLQQLQQQSAGWQEEWQALQTVKSSLEAMKDNEWLANEGCTTAAEMFMKILHKNQHAKFLLWADNNAEAIDELDLVHAPPTVPQGPIFQFGIESNPEALMGEE